MKNDGLAALEPLIGEWEYTIYNAWFLESMDTTMMGRYTIERLHGAFVVVRGEFEGKPDDFLVIGYSDPRAKYQVFSYDQRGVARIFNMTFDGTEWRYWREDPDFHQRFVAQVSKDRIQAYTEASEDEGKTWRKDFDITYVRVS
jgi:hypothetical protein